MSDRIHFVSFPRPALIMLVFFLIHVDKLIMNTTAHINVKQQLVPLIHEWFAQAPKDRMMTWSEVWTSFWGWCLENHCIRQSEAKISNKKFEEALTMCGITRQSSVISVLSNGQFLKQRSPEDHMIFPDLDPQTGRVKTPHPLVF